MDSLLSYLTHKFCNVFFVWLCLCWLFATFTLITHCPVAYADTSIQNTASSGGAFTLSNSNLPSLYNINMFRIDAVKNNPDGTTSYIPVVADDTAYNITADTLGNQLYLQLVTNDIFFALILTRNQYVSTNNSSSSFINDNFSTNEQMASSVFTYSSYFISLDSSSSSYINYATVTFVIEPYSSSKNADLDSDNDTDSLSSIEEDSSSTAVLCIATSSLRSMIQYLGQVYQIDPLVLHSFAIQHDTTLTQSLLADEQYSLSSYYSPNSSVSEQNMTAIVAAQENIELLQNDLNQLTNESQRLDQVSASTSYGLLAYTLDSVQTSGNASSDEEITMSCGQIYPGSDTQGTTVTTTTTRIADRRGVRSESVMQSEEQNDADADDDDSNQSQVVSPPLPTDIRFQRSRVGRWRPRTAAQIEARNAAAAAAAAAANATTDTPSPSTYTPLGQSNHHSHSHAHNHLKHRYQTSTHRAAMAGGGSRSNSATTIVSPFQSSTVLPDETAPSSIARQPASVHTATVHTTPKKQNTFNNDDDSDLHEEMTTTSVTTSSPFNLTRLSELLPYGLPSNSSFGAVATNLDLTTSVHSTTPMNAAQQVHRRRKQQQQQNTAGAPSHHRNDSFSGLAASDSFASDNANQRRDWSPFGTDIGVDDNRLMNPFAMQGQLTRWKLCHPRADKLTGVKINLLVSVGASMALTGTLNPQANVVYSAVQSLVSQANSVLLVQLGMFLQLAHVFIHTTASNVADIGGTNITTSWNFGYPTQANNGCPSDPSAIIPILQSVRTNPAMPPAAITHLIHGCYSTGMLGQAYVGSARTTTYSLGWSSMRTSTAWVTFLHEILHNLGGVHPFGTNVTLEGLFGGVMDYGTPPGQLLRGPYQGSVGLDIDTEYGPVCSVLGDSSFWVDNTTRDDIFAFADTLVPVDVTWLCNAKTDISQLTSVRSALPSDYPNYDNDEDGVVDSDDISSYTAANVVAGTFSCDDEISTYSLCSSTCSSGSQTRYAACVNTLTGQVVSSTQCTVYESKPVTSRLCSGTAATCASTLQSSGSNDDTSESESQSWSIRYNWRCAESADAMQLLLPRTAASCVDITSSSTTQDDMFTVATTTTTATTSSLQTTRKSGEHRVSIFQDESDTETSNLNDTQLTPGDTSSSSDDSGTTTTSTTTTTASSNSSSVLLGGWSTCSGLCGGGYGLQYRTIACGDMNTNTWVTSTQCSTQYNQPAATRECITTTPCEPDSDSETNTSSTTPVIDITPVWICASPEYTTSNDIFTSGATCTGSNFFAIAATTTTTTNTATSWVEYTNTSTSGCPAPDNTILTCGSVQYTRSYGCFLNQTHVDDAVCQVNLNTSVPATTYTCTDETTCIFNWACQIDFDNSDVLSANSDATIAPTDVTTCDDGSTSSTQWSVCEPYSSSQETTTATTTTTTTTTCPGVQTRQIYCIKSSDGLASTYGSTIVANSDCITQSSIATPSTQQNCTATTGCPIIDDNSSGNGNNNTEEDSTYVWMSGETSVTCCSSSHFTTLSEQLAPLCTTIVPTMCTSLIQAIYNNMTQILLKDPILGDPNSFGMTANMTWDELTTKQQTFITLALLYDIYTDPTSYSSFINAANGDSSSSAFLTTLSNNAPDVVPYLPNATSSSDTFEQAIAILTAKDTLTQTQTVSCFDTITQKQVDDSFCKNTMSTTSSFPSSRQCTAGLLFGCTTNNENTVIDDTSTSTTASTLSAPSSLSSSSSSLDIKTLSMTRSAFFASRILSLFQTLTTTTTSSSSSSSSSSTSSGTSTTTNANPFVPAMTLPLFTSTYDASSWFAPMTTSTCSNATCSSEETSSESPSSGTETPSEENSSSITTDPNHSNSTDGSGSSPTEPKTLAATNNTPYGSSLLVMTACFLAGLAAVMIIHV